MTEFSPSQIAAWCGGEWGNGAPKGAILGFSKDSRTIGRSECYVALVGENHDGHDFVKDAAEKGASCAIVSGTFRENPGIPLLKVSDTGAALQSIASQYRRKIDPFVIGVTGSSGKTTVKEMIAACLSSAFATASTAGNLNNHIGLPLSLLKMSADTQYAVMEIGMNHPGELDPLCRILEPDWGVVTNVGPVHMQAFDSVEAIAAEKAVLVEHSSDRVFLDADGRYFELLSSAASCPVVTVSRDPGGDYTYALDKTLCVAEKATGQTVEIRLPVPGLHIAYDACLSVAVARSCGIDWDLIVKALESYRPLPMRWEVHEAGGVKIVNDAYNANPMSMRASVEAFLREPVKGKRCLVLGDMLELGGSAAEEHRRLGHWLDGEKVDVLITVGELGKEIAVLADCNQITAVGDSESVLAELEKALLPGDAVFFKASRGLHLETVVSALSEYLKRNSI